jgi:hypothetical protein
MLRASSGGANGFSPAVPGDDSAAGGFASGFAAAFGRET